jgi:poly(3-hydroxybutyrate) depolymerase
MNKISTCLMALAMLVYSGSSAQRYLTEVFTDVDVQSDIPYGVNATVILYAQLGQAVPQPLVMDIYSPSGDTETNRPVILYFHTGNFLPTPQNGSPSGTKTDLNVVEMCTRLARMGYVVASCDYRMGWNPVATTQEERVFTLINAAYRGVQDCRTAIRYFRKTEAENANPYGIDPSRICVWGQGTGGYISFAAATINQYSDIAIPKFTRQIEVPPGSGNFITVPMVIEEINGDIYGTSVGINPNDGDTLCYPNHVGYSSDFNVMVNMGGACGDSSWVTEGDVPMISFHAPSDPFAPYGVGTVIVPGFNLPVVEVSGSFHVQEMANAFGLNTVFAAADSQNDVYTVQANTYNDGNTGLYPLNRPVGSEADSAPWEWWTADNPNNLNGLATNPDMSMTKGMTYLDTIQGYSAPRIMCAMGLAGSPCDPNNVVERQTSVRIYPNPSAGLFNVNLSVAQTIRTIEVYDLMGKRVMEFYPNTAQVVLDLSSLTNGIYTVKIKSDESNQSVRIQKI